MIFNGCAAIIHLKLEGKTGEIDSTAKFVKLLFSAIFNETTVNHQKWEGSKGEIDLFLHS